MVEIFENIRKIYEFGVPCSELADHIEFFSESSSDATRALVAEDNFSIKMFPSWTPTFYINLGERYQISVGSRLYGIGKDQDIAILRNSIVERHNAPTDHIFTVKFFPGSLERVLNFSQTSLVDCVVNLTTILPAWLLSAIKEVRTFNERVTLLECYFLDRLSDQRNHRVDFIRKAISHYISGDLLPGIVELAEKQFVSSKTLNRNFHRVVGTSPKNYFSVIRARTALSAYVLRDPLFTPTAFGYYDMSHFYKEVFAFTRQKLTVSKRLI